MKILMVNGTYGGVSGSGRAVKLLSEELIRRSFEVNLATNQTVGYLNIPKLKSISFAILAKLRQKTRCDVVHVHNPKFSIVAEKTFDNVLTIHGDYMVEFSLKYGTLVSSFFNRLLSHEMAKFKTVTCISPYWSKLRSWEYVPNGLDLNQIEEISPSNEQYVLFVGRKDKIKGYHLFEQAVKKTPHPYKMLGIYEKVPWKQVISYMKSAHCLVLPSEQEGMPYVVLEAWASGCPIIATDLPTLRSFGQDAIYFLKERNVENIKDAINTLIKNPDLATNLKRIGLENVKEFSIQRVVDKYISIYERILN